MRWKWSFDKAQSGPGRPRRGTGTRNQRARLRQNKRFLRRFMPLIAPEVFKALEQHHKRNFDLQQGPTGKWRPLAELTRAFREREIRRARTFPWDYDRLMHQYDKILQWSGRLRTSLTGEMNPLGRPNDRVRRVGLRSLTFGTRVPYADVHQYGGASTVYFFGYNRAPMATSIKVPPRPPLDDVYGPQRAMDVVEQEVLDALVTELD